MISAKYLCRKHLLGEHLENHMLAGCLKEGKNLKGYIDNGLVELHNLKERHEELALEMSSRGYNHKSPFSSEYTSNKELGKVDRERSFRDLIFRCPECKNRIGGNYKNI